MPGNAPVDAVGGTRDEGPWPEDVEEIVEGDAYRREVTDTDGNAVEREVTIQEVREVTLPDGTPTGGYIVRFTHGGGA